MQLDLAFLDPLDPPWHVAPGRPLSTAWERLDETSRTAALDLLARLIARMLAARAMEASDE